MLFSVFSAHNIRGLLKKFNSLILFLTPSLLQSWPVTLDTDDTRKGRLPGVYRAPTAEMLSYLDFSVSTTGMLAGIKMVRPGVRLGDIGHTIQKLAESERFSVVREYCGHGIGAGFHPEQHGHCSSSL